MGGRAARRGLLCCSRRRRPPAQARQGQVAFVLELARVSLHRARHQHDGLCDQRSQFRSDHRRLRPVGAAHGLVDTLWTRERKGDDGLARKWRRLGAGGRARHASIQSRRLPQGMRGMRRRLPDPCDRGARRRPRRRLRTLRRLSALHRSLSDRRDDAVGGLGLRGDEPTRPAVVRSEPAAGWAGGARTQGLRPQPAHSACRRRIVQRLRVRNCRLSTTPSTICTGLGSSSPRLLVLPISFWSRVR